MKNDQKSFIRQSAWNEFQRGGKFAFLKIYLCTTVEGKEHSMASDFKSSHYTITAKQGSALHHPVLGHEIRSSDPHQEFNQQQYWNGLQKPTIHPTVGFCKWAMYQQENKKASLKEGKQFIRVVNLSWVPSTLWKKCY